MDSICYSCIQYNHLAKKRLDVKLCTPIYICKIDANFYESDYMLQKKETAQAKKQALEMTSKPPRPFSVCNPLQVRAIFCKQTLSHSHS
jgi:hypothetical protein